MVGIIGSGAVRAAGVIRLTDVIFGIAGVINLVLDYLLIFGIGPFPALGLRGAAIATAISFVFIFIGMIVILVRRGMLGRTNFNGAAVALRQIISFGIPTIAAQSLVPATAMVATYLIAGFGFEAVAAFGVASRIEALALIGVFAVSAALTPFIAQNFGANEHAALTRP